MRSVAFFRAAILIAILLVCGCNSNNKGKIEGTRWTSLASTVKGQSVPADALQLAFGGDNRMIYRIKLGTGPDETFKGTYSLGFGDYVTLEFDRQLAGMKTHMQTVAINGDRLTMTDTDGTSMTFAKK